MAYTSYEIDSYHVYQYNEDSSVLTAQINCNKGHDFKGALQFYKDSASVPASFKSNIGLFLRFNEHKFRDIIETLRLEKPLYIRFNDDSRVGYLATSKEPVGEEEA